MSGSEKLTVGVSVAATQDAHVWSSGIHQNIAFLVMSLRAAPNVGKVVLLNGGTADSLPSTLEFDALQVPLVKPQDVTHEIDVVIEMGARLPQPWLRRVKALGVKVIAFLVGHSYTCMIEPVIFKEEAAIGLVGMEPDEVWMLEKDLATSETLMRTLLRVPVVVMPHIWSPMFMDRQLHALEAAGHRWGFEATARARAADGWGAAIFEPNVGVVKSCFIPMLACETAYREQPQGVKNMMVMNSAHMKEHQTFNRFAAVLDLTSDGKASYEPRITVPECMSRFGRDVVVSHHWENEQNYLYYDVLYGGYPLVHNSRWLAQRAPGFFYPDFEARKGGRALLDAWQQPPEYWQDYRKNARAFLAHLHPEHESHVQTFMARLTPARSASIE